MIRVTLSGGEFGGQEVFVPESAAVYEAVDTNGATWRYRVEAAAGVAVLAEVFAAS